MSLSLPVLVTAVNNRLRGTGGRTTNINNANSGGSTTASAGGSTGLSSGGAGEGSSVILGEVLKLVPGTGDVPYAIGPNSYGIQGNAFLAKSTKGNTITVGNDEGKICIKGSLEEVPNGDYGGYWGVEIGFNLNQPINEGQGGASGGGAGGATGRRRGKRGLPVGAMVELRPVVGVLPERPEHRARTCRRKQNRGFRVKSLDSPSSSKAPLSI